MKVLHSLMEFSAAKQQLGRARSLCLSPSLCLSLLCVSASLSVCPSLSVCVHSSVQWHMLTSGNFSSTAIQELVFIGALALLYSYLAPLS